MNRVLIRYLAVLAGFLATHARAEGPARDHEITAEDYFTLSHVSDVQVSPDGKHVAWSELRWEPPAEKRNSDIWAVEVKSGDVRRLTFDSSMDGSPRWSSDGRHIYFTSNRKGPVGDSGMDGKTQVWRVPATGGEITPVTRLKDGVGAFDVARDGNSLYYTVRDEHVGDEFGDLKKKYKSLEYGHGVDGFTQLWKLNLDNWRAEKVADEKRMIRHFAVAPDGWRIAMITTPTEHLIHHEGQSRVDIFDTKSKKFTALPDKLWRQDAPSPFGWLEGLSWSTDGQKLAFRVEYDGYPAEILIASFKGPDATIQKLERAEQITVPIGSPMQWRRADDLCFVAEDRGRARVYCTANIKGGKQGPTRELTTGDVAVGTFGFDRTGQTLAITMSDATHQSELYTVAFEKSPSEYKSLARINPQVDSWKLPKIEIVKWKSREGQECEGILETPPDYTSGKLPMVVELHGGPTASTLAAMQFSIYGRTLLPAKGYAVFSPNYRGSTGYGDKFMIDLVGRENDVEVDDILTGVDAMIEKGVADGERLGVMGWSNGGYLTNCLITKTTRFKGASSGAGIASMLLQWGDEDTPGHVINYMRGLPWNRAEAYAKASPIMNADKVRTPTLFHVGAGDERCPPAHQKAMYRALKEYVNVPAELVVYPGEGHGLTKYEFRKAKMEWDVAWFERHVLGKMTEMPKKEEKGEEVSKSG